MRDEDAVNLVLQKIFDEARLPRVAEISDSNDEFADAVASLAGHKQLLLQVNEFIFPQPRGLALAEPDARGRIVAWVDGSRAELEKLERAEPERDWRVSEIAEACGLTNLGAGIAVLYRSSFLQGCRNVGEWNTDTGLPGRVLLAPKIRRPRESLAELVRRHTLLQTGVTAEVASREAERLGTAISSLDQLEAQLAKSVRERRAPSTTALSSLLADLPDIPAPRPSLDDLRAPSCESTLAEYRRRLLRRRRSASRIDIELLVNCIEATLDDLHEITGIRGKTDGPVVSVKGPAWERLQDFLRQLSTALGTWNHFGSALSRHLGFGQSGDFIDIVTTDWPESRARIAALDFEPLEVSPPDSSPGNLEPVHSTRVNAPGPQAVNASPVERTQDASDSLGTQWQRRARRSGDHDRAATSRDEVLRALREWATSVHMADIAQGAHVFGSLVTDDGEEFDLSGSDVDLMLVLPRSAASPLERATRLEQLAKLTPDLELRLMRILKRSDAGTPITSINVVTETELTRHIHKGGEPAIFRSSFLNLLAADPAPSPMRDAVPFDHSENREAVFAVQGAQKFRNRFVRNAANGSAGETSWDGEDPIPKEIARAASRLRFVRDARKGDSEFSINKGYVYVENLVESAARTEREFAALAKWLAPRRGGRGKATPLSPSQQLLLWEMLAADAEKLLQQPGRGRSVANGGDEVSVQLSTEFASQLVISDQRFWKTTVDMLVSRLHLKRWNWFVDSAVRELVDTEVLRSADELGAFVLASVWPRSPEPLVSASKKLLGAFLEWTEYFVQNAEPRANGEHYGPSKAFARSDFNPRYDQYVEFEQQWADRCYWLLCSYIVHLNLFCDAVREWLDPSFFRVFGKFLLVDSMGFRTNSRSSVTLPSLEAVEEGLKRNPAPRPIPPPRNRDEEPRPWPILQVDVTPVPGSTRTRKPKSPREVAARKTPKKKAKAMNTSKVAKSKTKPAGRKRKPTKKGR
ncbi:MAG TPA: nucleotidyltransferase domain-containing protein [Kofleriaceae bacterium]|jgi:hypothetical protein